MWLPFSALLLLWLAGLMEDPAGLLRAGEFERALGVVDSQLKAEPGNARLLTMRGIALGQLGRETDALNAYRKALAHSPDYLPALEGAAQIEYKTGSADAVVHLSRLIKLNARDETAHAMRGALAARAGRCEQAVEDFASAPDELGKQPEAQRQYGTCLFRLRRWGDAEKAFGVLLQADPRDRRAAYGLASAQMQAGKFEEAVKTLQAFADDAQALALAAHALEAMGRTPEAIASLRSAIVADPRRESFYTQFAEFCFTYKSYQAGVDVIGAGLTQLPASAKLYLARGILLVQQGNYDAADKDFATADKLDPREASSADAETLALIQANRLDEARGLLDEKIKQHPRDAQLHFFQADVLSRLNDNKGSMATVKQAIALRADFPMAHDLLARLYLQNGDEERAIRECQAALKSDPQDETALYRWLRILNARHRESDAGAIAEVTERWKQAREKQKEADVRESRYRIFTNQ